jgi:SAM-dependent methyltransferase
MSGNRFDDYRPDVAGLHRSLTATQGAHRRRRWRSRLGRALHRRLVHANLALAWFHEFARYWTEVLGNRPLEPPDFQFLRGVYRRRLQDFTLDGRPHLDVWQSPETVAVLLSAVYREALHPWRHVDTVRLLPRGARVLEFGCGIAPYTTMLLRGFGLRWRCAIADLPTLPSHYARWRLGDTVGWRELDAMAPDLGGPYDAIVCSEVFEHVPSPREMVDRFHAALVPSGLLLYDFIASDGTGLDHPSAVGERHAALAVIRERFSPTPQQPASITAVRRAP